jgi:Flp pilus assembly protein TadD
VLEKAGGNSSVLELEPDHAGALTGLGEALLRMGRGGEARRPLERAVRLQPDDPQAHHLLAQVLLFHDWEWEAAERHLGRAMELRPEHAATYQVRAYREVMTGRMDDALASMATALRLDPLSSYVQADAGWIHYWAGRFDEAVARCRRTLELDAESGSARTCLLFARIAQGDGLAAREAARALMLGHQPTAADLAALDGADPQRGLVAYWSWEARRLEALPERSPHDAFLLALAWPSGAERRGVSGAGGGIPGPDLVDALARGGAAARAVAGRSALGGAGPADGLSAVVTLFRSW